MLPDVGEMVFEVEKSALSVPEYLTTSLSTVTAFPVHSAALAAVQEHHWYHTQAGL